MRAAIFRPHSSGCPSPRTPRGRRVLATTIECEIRAMLHAMHAATRKVWRQPRQNYSGRSGRFEQGPNSKPPTNSSSRSDGHLPAMESADRQLTGDHVRQQMRGDGNLPHRRDDWGLWASSLSEASGLDSSQATETPWMWDAEPPACRRPRPRGLTAQTQRPE